MSVIYIGRISIEYILLLVSPRVIIPYNICIYTGIEWDMVIRV